MMRRQWILRMLGAVCLMSCGALADEVRERTLQEVMQELGGQFKALMTLARDPAKTVEAADASAVLRQTVLQALPMVPEKVSQAPESDRRALLVQYQGLILQLAVEATHAESAFLMRDAAAAQAALKNAGTIRQQGHELFK